jgi:hypothetical protein
MPSIGLSTTFITDFNWSRTLHQLLFDLNGSSYDARSSPRGCRLVFVLTAITRVQSHAQNIALSAIQHLASANVSAFDFFWPIVRSQCTVCLACTKAIVPIVSPQYTVDFAYTKTIVSYRVSQLSLHNISHTQTLSYAL